MLLYKSSIRPFRIFSLAVLKTSMTRMCFFVNYSLSVYACVCLFSSFFAKVFAHLCPPPITRQLAPPPRTEWWMTLGTPSCVTIRCSNAIARWVSGLGSAPYPSLPHLHPPLPSTLQLTCHWHLQFSHCVLWGCGITKKEALRPRPVLFTDSSFDSYLPSLIQPSVSSGGPKRGSIV